MNVIRTITWMILTALVVTFVIINWTEPVAINFWINATGKPQGFTWPVAVIAIFSFFLGLLPMWLLHKGAAWRFKRRIGTLENSAKISDAPVATTTAPPEPAKPEPPFNPL